MTDTIRLEFKNGPETIKIIMPKDEKLFKRALLVLGLEKTSEVVSSTINDDSWDYSRRASLPRKLCSDMRHNGKFKIIFKMLSDSYEQNVFHSIRIDNIKQILVENETKTAKISIDKNQWKEKIKSISEVKESKVKQILIHIKGEIEKDDGQAIIDMLNQRFENIPARAFFSNNGADVTLVEIIFFGNQIKNKADEDGFWSRS